MSPVGPSTPSFARAARNGAFAALALGWSCAGGGATRGSVGPPLDAEAIASAAAEANQIPGTARVNFDWSLREPNLNVRGEGLARVQPPDRARLDLFMGGGSSVLAVALVADDLRTPEGAPRDVIPSPPLLWASFGFFRPGDDSIVLGAEQVGDRIRLRYQLADSNELHYYLTNDRVVGVEMFVADELVHRVDLDVPDVTQLATVATYRNIPAFRELQVTVSGIENVDEFSERIWSPGR